MRIAVALALTILIVGAFGCKRSELDAYRSKWSKLPVSPATGAILLKQAEGSACAWKVQASDEVITIRHDAMQKRQWPREIRTGFPGGILVGEDKGEWGGSLSVLEGSNRAPREILNKNVLQMFPMRDGVAVITGELPSNDGSVWLYSNPEGRGWTIQKKADLHGYPKVIEKSGERLLLAFGDAVSIMDNFKERQIAALPLLDLSPNSIAQDAKGDIYMGMNGFVVRLVPQSKGYSQQWFTQRGCLD